MLNMRSHKSRETGYYNPLGLAEFMISMEMNLPYDLEEQLVSMGIIVEELRDSLLKDTDSSTLTGFSLV